MNSVLFDKIVNYIEEQKHNRNDMDFIIKEISNDPKKSIISVEQIILKAIKQHNQIPRQNMKYLQNLLYQIFDEIGDQLIKKNLQQFYDSFLDFFALGIQSGNHKLKTTFVSFLKVMIQKYPKQKFSQKKSDNLYQACVSLFSENQIERKKLAIEILNILQDQQQYQEEIENYFLQIVAEEQSESLRKYALQKIKVTKQNVNFLSHRIKDVNLEIRSILMDKFISAENILFKDLDKNSFYFIIYNCIFINEQELKYKLTKFLFKDIEQSNNSAKIINLFNIISFFDLKHVFIFEKLYTTLKQYIFFYFDSQNSEFLKYIIEQVMEKVFDEKNIEKPEYKYYLLVFLFLFYYITGKLTQNQVTSQEIQFQTHEKDLEIVNYSNIEDYIQSKLPTNLRILNIIQQIFKKEGNLIEKQLIVQYSTFADLQDNVRVQIQELFENYIKYFQIENIDIENKLQEINIILESFTEKKEFFIQQRDLFIPPLTTIDLFQIYFLRKDNPEFVPVIFKQDILNFVFKRLYYFGHFNDDEYFFSFVKNLIKDIEEQVQDSFQKNLQIAFYLQFTMFNVQDPSQKTIKTFSQKVKSVIQYLSNQKDNIEENNKKFVNLCLYKSIALMIFGNIKQFLIHGKFFKKFVEDENQQDEYKMISYAIFGDFLLSHNYKDIHQAFIDCQKDDDELLDMNQVIEDLRQEFWQQSNSVLTNLLCSSFCKLIYNNPKVFQALGIQDIEILASLMIKQKDDRLKSENLTDLATIQLLTIFFFRTNMLSEKSNYKIIWSFVVVANLLQILEQKSEKFNQEVLQINLDKGKFLEVLTKDMIGFTCLSKYKQMQKWKFSNYFDLKPQEIVYCYFLKDPFNVSLLKLLNKNATYFTMIKFADERILRFVNNQLLNLKQQLQKYPSLKKQQQYLQETIDNLDRDMIEGLQKNDLTSQQQQKEIDEDQQEIEKALYEKWEEYDKLALTFCKSLREFKVIIPANNQITQNIKINQMLESNKEFLLIDQYRISQQLEQIQNFFDVIRAFSTKSHNHIKVLVHLVNNLIESEDFLTLLDSTLFTKGEFKLENFPVQTQNNNNDLQNMSSTQIVGSVKKEQNPLVNELLKNQDNEFDKISMFIEQGQQNTNNLKDQLKHLMSKLDNMSVKRNKTPDSNNRNIEIRNHFERANSNRNPNNMSLNNPRYQSNYGYDNLNEVYKNRSQIQDNPNRPFDMRRASDQELFMRSRPASIDKELYDKLRNQKNKLKQENYKKEQKILDLQDELDEFKKKLEPVLNYNDQLTDQIKKYKGQNKKLQREIEDFKSLFQQKQQDIPELHRENLQMKQQLGDQKQIIQQLKNQLQDSLKNQQNQIPFVQFDKDDNNNDKENQIIIKKLKRKYQDVLDKLDDEKKAREDLQRNLNDTSQKLDQARQKKIEVKKGNVNDLLKCVYVQCKYIDNGIKEEIQYQELNQFFSQNQ